MEITPNATDFRLLSRRAIDALNQFDERNRYLRGFAHWIGFKRCPVVYDRLPRTGRKVQGAVVLSGQPRRQRHHLLLDQAAATLLARPALSLSPASF